MNAGRSKLCGSSWGPVAAAAAVVVALGGGGSMLGQTDVEYEAVRTLRELQIEPAVEPNVSVPEIHRPPPKIVEQTVGGVSEWKLFYFGKCHTSDTLKNIIHEQFATKLFDPKG
ncbi:MAG: hypothetical protein ACYS74_22950, partial [Planctomycetota bacterium]